MRSARQYQPTFIGKEQQRSGDGRYTKRWNQPLCLAAWADGYDLDNTNSISLIQRNNRGLAVGEEGTLLL
jgi:hypothetical protein